MFGLDIYGWRRWLLALLLLVPGQVPAEGRALNHFSVDYDVQVKGITVGAAIWQVKPIDETTNLFRVELATRGLVEFFYPVGTSSESIWEYTETGRVRPLRFRYSHSRRPNRNLAVDFDWEAEQATVNFRGKERDEALTPQTYDTQLFLLELGMRAAAGENPILFETIGNKRRSQRKAQVLGLQEIETSGGKISAWCLYYADDEKKTTIWYSTEHHLLPLLIEYIDRDGTEVTLSATGMKVEGKALEKMVISEPERIWALQEESNW